MTTTHTHTVDDDHCAVCRQSLTTDDTSAHWASATSADIIAWTCSETCATTYEANRTRTYPTDYCLVSHVGGYGDCILRPGHVSAHQDAHGYKFRDEDNRRIMAERLAFLAAARNGRR